MRLIDADKFVEMFDNDAMSEVFDYYGNGYTYKEIMRILNNVPTYEPKWINVEDKLPENGTTVLGYSLENEDKLIYEVAYMGEFWRNYTLDCDDIISYWMPISEKPDGY